MACNKSALVGVTKAVPLPLGFCGHATLKAIS